MADQDQTDLAEIRGGALPWIETVVLVGLVPALGFGVHRQDPLFMHGAFPWCLLAPLLAGLRYGFKFAFAASIGLVVLFVAAWKHALPMPVEVSELPTQLVVGVTVCAILGGEFNDWWRRRMRGLRDEALEVRTEIATLAREHEELRASHDLLEAAAGSEPASLREALRAIRDLAGQGGPGSADFGRAVLDVAARFCGVRMAALFLFPEEGEPPTGGRPDAMLGEVQVDLDDPLVREALRRKVVVSIDPLAEARRPRTRLLIAAPLVDGAERIHGVLAVANLPFAALTPGTLKRLAVIAGRVADLLTAAGADRDAPVAAGESFAAALRRAEIERRQLGTASGFVEFACAPSSAQENVRTLTGALRATDRWLVQRDGDGTRTVSVVLPFSGDLGRARYVARMRALVSRARSVPWEDAGITILRQTTVAEEEGWPSQSAEQVAASTPTTRAS